MGGKWAESRNLPACLTTCLLTATCDCIKIIAYTFIGSYTHTHTHTHTPHYSHSAACKRGSPSWCHCHFLIKFDSFSTTIWTVSRISTEHTQETTTSMKLERHCTFGGMKYLLLANFDKHSHNKYDQSAKKRVCQS